MQHKEIEVFYPISVSHWRKWLTENYLSKQSGWPVFYKKNSDKTSITWRESQGKRVKFSRPLRGFVGLCEPKQSPN